MLTPRQWIGVGLLVAIIATTKVVLWVIDNQHTHHLYSPAQVVLESPETAAIQLRPFDPNKADSATFLRLGLRPWQIRNIMKYRAKGGRYHAPEDFQSLYGLTDSAYHRLLPYIRIDSTEWVARRDSLRRLRYTRDSLRYMRDSLRYDSILLARHIHPKKDTIIELNTADSTDLLFIRGIGSYLAQQIIRFRDDLGGYYSPQQVYDIPHTEWAGWDTIIPHLTADTSYIQRLPVNHASKAQLARHPYLRYEQAKAIYNLRRQKFRLHHINDLRELPSLSSDEIERLRPYLDWE